MSASTKLGDGQKEEVIANIGAASAERNAAGVVMGKLSSARQEREATAAAAVTTTTTVTQANAQQRQEFNSELSKCLASFSEFAKRLGVDIDAYIEAGASALSLPKLKQQFDKLPHLCKTLLVLGILGTLALLHWVSWESISYLWGRLMGFVNSETGQKMLQTFAGVLGQLNNSGVVDAFGMLLSTAVEKQKAEGEQMDTDVTPELNASLDVIKQQLPVIQIVTIITALFNYFTSAPPHATA